MVLPRSQPAVIIGETTFRNQHRKFGLRIADRRSHVYVIGKTGTGKSTLLRNLVLQDLPADRGGAVFDPHGDLTRELLTSLGPALSDRVIHLDVPDPTLRWSFNPLAGIAEDRHAFAVASFVDVFRKLWSSDWGPRLEHVLRNVIFTLLENPGSTLADIPALLADRDYRREFVDALTSEPVREFWTQEFDGYSAAFRAVVVAPLQNKLGALLTDPTLRRIVTGSEHALDLRELMDSGKLLLVNLEKGRIGEGPAALLGSLLVSHLAIAGFSRADTPEEERQDFALYLDEFHTFTTLSLATMLSELRKYRVSLVLAHQYLGQLDPAIRDAAFGNAGTLISFRLSAQDAEFVAREFAPQIEPEDLIRLPPYQFYIRLMVGGATSPPFSGRTIHPSRAPTG